MMEQPTRDGGKGLLLVVMEPPAGLEEEFHDWYDTEHLPQRRSLPGFESGSRWVCLSGWPRWLATYDLDTPDAVSTAEYRAVSGANSTPWSRRVLPRTIGRERVVARQVHPGHAAARDTRAVVRLVLARFEGLPSPEQLRRVEAALAPDGGGQVRTFVDVDDERDAWLIAECARPLSADAAAAPFAGIAATRLINLYAPYVRLAG